MHFQSTLFQKFPSTKTSHQTGLATSSPSTCPHPRAVATPSKRKAEEADEEGNKKPNSKHSFAARASEAWSLVDTTQAPIARQIKSERDLSIAELTECYRIFAQAFENNPVSQTNFSSIPVDSKTWRKIFSKRCYVLPSLPITWPVVQEDCRAAWHGDIPIGFIGERDYLDLERRVSALTVPRPNPRHRGFHEGCLPPFETEPQSLQCFLGLRLRQ